MKTFYFNTGVKYANYPSLFGTEVVRGGTKQIPVHVGDEVPDDAVLMSLCDNPDLISAKAPHVMAVPVLKSEMASKYAYFHVR